MNRFLIAAGAAAFLAVSPLTALAEEATGMISSIDAAAGTVTLESGETFTLPVDFDAASLQVGEVVTIEYQAGADGEMDATSVQPAT